MNTKPLFTLLLISVIALATAANMPKVKNRQCKEQQRIHQGVYSGELTKPEAYVLSCQQARIQHAKVNAKSDGVITPFEKVKLDNMQDHASQNIFHQKHDRQDRF